MMDNGGPNFVRGFGGWGTRSGPHLLFLSTEENGRI
jgi:hypothetical protein